MDLMFHSILNGNHGRHEFHIDESEPAFNVNYFLADGIYPSWSTFVKPLSTPTTQAEKAFNQAQESERKCVERLFGVVQGRWKIMRSGNRIEYREKAFCCEIVTVSVIHLETFRS